MATIYDESGAPITDESGADIQDEAGGESLTVQGANHVLNNERPILASGEDITVQDVYNILSGEVLTLQAARTLVVQDSHLAINSEIPSLSSVRTIAVQGANHIVKSAVPTLVSDEDLLVHGANHSHQADVLELMSSADAQTLPAVRSPHHKHNAENVYIASPGDYTLVVRNPYHQHDSTHITYFGTWSSWIVTTGTELTRMLTESERDNLGSDANIRIQVKAVDTFGNESAVSDTNLDSGSLNIQETDIADFAITASKIFTKIPVLESDSWTNNSPAAGSVAWNEHYIYYNGVKYTIVAGNTDLKYIYWKDLKSSYEYSDTHPAELASWEPGEDFIIAINISGSHQLAWNAIANQAIGSAYIQDAAIQTVHVDEIHGNRITANSLTLDKINGTSGTLDIYVSDGITIKDGGDIKVEAGGDIKLYYANLNEAEIAWYDITEDKLFLITSGGTADGGIYPANEGSENFEIGGYVAGPRWEGIYIVSTEKSYIQSRYDADNQAHLEVGASSSTGKVDISVTDGGTTGLFRFYEARFYTPNDDKVIDIGHSSNAFDDVYADDFQNVADFLHLDEFDDLQVINNIKGSGKIDSRTGREIIDDDTLPEWLLTKSKDGEEVLYDADGKPYVSLKMAISLAWGGIRQLSAEVEKLKKS